MRKVTAYLLILFFVLITSNAFSQSSVKGVVTDADDGKVLPGATIRAGEYRGTYSSETGEFALNNIPTGVAYLEVSYIGYQTIAFKIPELKSEVQIRLTKSNYQADEVIINATRVSDKTGMAYSNVHAEAIEKQNLGQDLPVLLNFTPSLVSTSDAGGGVGYTGIRIRGSDATRINVTVNGIPYNDAESSGVYWVNMPDMASSVNSIQIQRGVGSSTNGAGAFGATINVNTNTFHKDGYAELNNSFGSFNTFKNTIKLGSGLIKDKFTIDARLSRVSSDGFVDRAKSDLKSYYLSGGYFGKRSFVRVNVFSGKEITYQSWYGSPEAKVKGDKEGILAYISRNWLNERDAQNLLNANDRTYNYYTYKNEVDNYKQDHYQILSSHSLNDKLTFNVNGFLVKGKGYYEQYRDNDSYSLYNIPNVIIGADTLPVTDLVRRRWLDNYFFGTTFSLDYNSFKKLTANFGGGWNQYNGGHYGEIIWARYAGSIDNSYRYYYSKGVKKDFNLYGKVYFQFSNKLNAYGDFQFRTVSHDILGMGNDRIPFDVYQSYVFYNPKAGINYQLTDQSSIYASYSIGNKEPNRDDLINAPDKDPPKKEFMQDIEAGFRTSGGNWAVSANYYLMAYKNQLVLTGQVNDVGTAIRTNVPASYRTGIELEGALAINKKLKWNVNASFSQNKIQNFTEYVFDYKINDLRAIRHGKSDISFSPNLIAGSQLSFALSKSLEAVFLTKYVSKQYLDNTSDIKRSIDPYVTNDVRLTWSVKPKWSNGLSVSLLVNNVFNELYESNGYTYGYISDDVPVQENFYYPQAGTNFLLGLNLKF